METIKLNVGDKVYYSKNYYSELNYKTSTVERLTKTQAILKNGDKIKNETNGYNNDFNIIGSHGYYQLMSEEVQKEIDIILKKRKIENWFATYKFTDKEKEMVYNLFKK